MCRVGKSQLDLAHAAGQAFSQLKEGLFETDLDYNLVLINDYGARLAGYPDVASCLAARPNVAALLVAAADLRRILTALERNESLCGYVCRMYDAQRELHWIEASINRLRDDSGQQVGYWGVFRDLTPQQEMTASRDRLHAELLQALGRLEHSERVIRRKNAELEARNRDLRDYSASVTHDLRAPLAAVKGFAEMLLDLYGGALDDRGRRLVERIGFNARQMDRIIRGLQELVLLGEQSEPAQRVDPGAVLRTAAENRPPADERTEPELEVQPEMPALEMQPTRLYLLLDNLLSNARKQLAQIAHGRIRFGCRAGAEPVFFVEDNGGGVAAEHREHVFELFFRTDRSQPGVGLGLSIARRVVELYGGCIWVESVEPHGARFCFTLPAARPAASAPPAPGPKPSP